MISKYNQITHKKSFGSCQVYMPLSQPYSFVLFESVESAESAKNQLDGKLNQQNGLIMYIRNVFENFW